MKRVDILKSLILESLVDDNERFEAIYFLINGRAYQNLYADCSPSYRNLDEMYHKNDIYIPREVYNSMKELITDGFIECLKVIEDNTVRKIVHIKRPNFNDFSEFASYWFKVSDKGLKLIK